MSRWQQGPSNGSGSAISTSVPGAPDDAWDSTVTSGTASAAIGSSLVSDGDLWMECTQSTTASSNGYGRKAYTSETSFSMLVKAYWNTIPASNQNWFRSQGNADATRWLTIDHGVGKLHFRLSSSDTVIYTTTATLAAATSYYVGFQGTTTGGTGSTGTIAYQLYDSTGALLESQGPNAGTALPSVTNFQSLRLGRITNTVTDSWAFRALKIDNGTTTPIVPSVALGTPPVIYNRAALIRAASF